MAGEPLPKGWQWTTLGTVANFVNGDRGENYPTQSDRVGIGVPFINTGHIEPNGRLVSTGMDYITRGSFERLRSGKVNPGDIFYCLRGSTIGKTARNHFTEGAIASSLVIVRAKENACQEYLYFYLISPLGRGLVAQHDNGSAQPNLSVRSLSNYPLPLPPVDEQRAIAHILGTLDDKIELNRRRNVTLEAMARALFQDWFVDFGPVRAKLEGRAPYLPPDLWNRFPDRLDDDGKPEGWETQPLSKLLSIIGGGTPKTANPEYWDGDIPWFSVVDTPSASDVFAIETEKSITDKGLAESSARLIPKGATIITARGTVGNLAMAGRDMTFNQSCYALRGTENVGDYFVYLTAQQMVDQLKSMAHGSVFSTITRNTFDAINQPVPSPAVLIAFENAVEPWFEKIFSNVEESRTLAQLRDTLLPKLISGELRVADTEKFVERVA